MAEGSRNGQLCGNVVSWIKTMLEQLPVVNVGCSIYRVPKLLREMNNTAFTPQVISIGPFHHHSRDDLIVKEQYKLQGLANFLFRMMNMSSVEFLVETTQTWVKDARDYYAEPINMNDEDFIKMLLVDGCFTVELLILNYGQYSRDAFIRIEHKVDLQFYKRFPHIGADLVKLENQSPFFVLQRLYLVKQKDPSISFITLTKIFFIMGLNGVFEIPPILNDDYFEPMMQNLIAFEHVYVGNDNKCIQYVSLLDHLICTEKDVSVLVKARIIINEIGGSSIEVSKLFNNLCKFVTVPNCCHFNDINKALREHCSRRWNKAIATLKHNYFNTPWAIVSFVGAIFLLIFALLQTIFSGIS
ncbi:UPF0481 protein At3g47200-like [Cucurbita maxima]|uniref:UPF0481 protein At3g47200-like n=1 Tax=Cucurbita maxima TaxID=3661 RepID=A0A6J1IDP8_CUCMA|nr:UPF0481 protein At3g47200-like [Cucurbita maxima]